MELNSHELSGLNEKPPHIVSSSEQGGFSEGLTPKKKKGKWFVITMFSVFSLPLLSVAAYYTTQAIVNAQRWNSAFSAAKEGCNIDSFSDLAEDYSIETISVGDKTVFPKDKKSFMRILSSSTLVETGSPVAFNKEDDVLSSIDFPEAYDLCFSITNDLEYSYQSGNPYFGYDFYLCDGDEAYLIYTRIAERTFGFWPQWGFRSVAGRSYSLTNADYQNLIDVGTKSLLG